MSDEREYSASRLDRTAALALVDAALNPPNVFKLAGQRRRDVLGNSVSASGDVNGDGIRDVAIGAAGQDGLNGDRFNSGASGRRGYSRTSGEC